MRLLEVEGLTAGYGALEVVRGLDFEVAEGEVVVILGANGAGKTTTLRALSGMLKARGKINLDGRTLVARSPDSIARRGVAHVPEGRGTFAEFTVEENLRLGAYLRSTRSEVRADIERWLGLFPRLRERLSQAAGSLSGGEQQMLAIARALMMRPRLLLIDEPSMGLAPNLTIEVFDALATMNRETGTSILLVEQNANLALDIAQRGYVIEHGDRVLSGTSDELRDNDAVRKAYLGI